MKSFCKLTILGTALALATLQAPLAYAHGDMKPQHGGRVQMTGETVIELVSNARGVDVYLREEDEPLPATAYNAKLIITAAGKRHEAMLRSGPGNRLLAPGLKLPAGARVVVALTAKAGGARIFATFPAQ